MGEGEGEEGKRKLQVSWKELGKHNKEGDAWLSVRGKVYNVSSWADQHPGGKDIILLNAGKDATQLFEAYHQMKTFQMLPKFEVGVLVDHEHPQYPPMSKFYKVLKERVEKYFVENKINCRDSPFLLSTSLFLFFAFFFTYTASILLLHNHFLVSILLALLVGWFASMISLIPVHEASHASLTRSPWMWRLLGATHDIANGASYYMWIHQHFLGHHPFTNVEGADPDIWVNDPDVRRILNNQQPRNYYRFQHLYAPLLYGLLAAKYRINDLVMWFSSRTNGKIRINPAGAWHSSIFIPGKVIFVVFRFIIPLFFIEFSEYWKVLVIGCIVDAVVSFYLAFVFQVSHVVPQAAWPQIKPAEKDLTNEESKNQPEHDLIDVDWAEAQVKTTIDYGHGSWLTTFLSGGLNYQVTHHLFPGVSQAHYPAIAPIVRETCKEFGLDYVVLPNFIEAFQQHLKYLQVMGIYGIHLD